MNSKTAHPVVSATPAPETAPAASALDVAFDGLAQLAARMCNRPVASIVLEGGSASWCSANGRLADGSASPRDPFAPFTAACTDVFAVRDARDDPRFRSAEGRVGGFEIRTYAGMGLRTARGERLGTLAVYDSIPREFLPEQRAALALIAQQVVSQLELRSTLAERELLTGGRAELASSGADTALNRALLESAPVAIYHTDGAGNSAYFNPAYRQLFGLKEDENDSDWVQWVHPDDRPRVKESWTDFGRAPRPMRFEYRSDPRKGAGRVLAEQVVPVGSGRGFVGTITDVTELIAVRDDLRRVESLFRNTFEQAPIGIAYADRWGTFMRCNEAFAELLGYAPGGLDGRSSFELTHGEDVGAVAAELSRLWNGDIEFVDLEKRYVHKQGHEVWVRLTSALIREGDTAPERAVEFVRDITATKAADLELERVHKQLMAASRQAGMAEVATNVLHNVGNILNSINISASLVADRVRQSKAGGLGRVAAMLNEQGANVGTFLVSDERGKRVPEYLATLGEQLVADQKATLTEIASLRENLEHIKETVTMQQTYAKLCGVTEVVNVNDLVEDSLRLNAGAFVRHGVTLQREYGEPLPITVDKHKVLQILVNLVRNAKYACDESGRQDKLLTLRVEATEAGARISIIDNGVGIAPENMGRLFHHGFTTRQSGHGFGLHSGAVAAQELGGSLRAESAGLGTGASFILELPRLPPGSARG
jgi:PAS domain S-box-containing protein